jgi:hypothetical protein
MIESMVEFSEWTGHDESQVRTNQTLRIKYFDR